MVKIFKHLEAFLKDHPVFLIKDFADSLPPELLPTLDEAFLWDIADLLEDAELLHREWDHAIREFTRLRLRRTIADVTKKFKHPGSSEEAESLQNDLRTLTGKLKELEKSASI